MLLLSDDEGAVVVVEEKEEKMLENQGEDEFVEGLKAKKRVKHTKVITKAYAKVEVFLGFTAEMKLLISAAAAVVVVVPL